MGIDIYLNGYDSYKERTKDGSCPIFVLAGEGVKNEHP
jgi:hypothetical protein